MSLLTPNKPITMITRTMRINRIMPLLSLAGLMAFVPAAHAGPGVHAEHVVGQPHVPPAGPEVGVPVAGTPASFKHWVYGYYASWAGTVADIRWDRVSHVALFDVEMTSTGELADVHLVTDVIEEALALAEPYGVRIHIAVICFDDVTMAAVLGDPMKRALAVQQLQELVEDYGAHGVSVDFEGMDAGNILDLVAFVEELKAVVPEVTVATPAVDWSQAYHYPKLAAAADALFIMGYDYHWSGGGPGPVAPLHGGAPWSQWSLEWTLGDYLATGVDPQKLIMGLPLYGRRWPTTDNSVPGESTGKATSMVYTAAVAEAGLYERHWDEVSHTPYYFPDGQSQVWYDDTASLSDKIGWSVAQGVLGVGFWALNYEGGDPAFWDMVAMHTQAPEEPETGSSGEDASSGGDASTGAGSSSSGAGSGESSGAGGSSSGGSDGSSSGGDGSTGGTSATGTGAEASGEDEGGCGCTQGGGGSLAGLLVLVAGVARRRRYFGERSARVS
jgi:MYXO-CTERM domain-containing protein